VNTRTASKRLACPEVLLTTNNDKRGQPAGTSGTYIPDYLALQRTYATYADVQATYATYNDLMWGHPGFPGGAAASGFGGYGLTLGYEDSMGNEWWVIDVSGWDDGAVVEADEQPGLTSGTFVDLVKERGRRVIIQGTVLGTRSPAEFREAKRVLAGALSSRPHTGRLTIGGVSLPVALAAQVRTKQPQWNRIDFELELVGRNIGTPGRGIWREAVTRDYPTIKGNGTYNINASADSYLHYNSAVSAGLAFQVTGPLAAGLKVTADYGSAGVRSVTFKAIPAGSVLGYDAANRRVTLNGKPALWVADEVQWLELTPILARLVVSGWGGATSASRMDLSITELS
jgi:hypothetical protein